MINQVMIGLVSEGLTSRMGIKYGVLSPLG